VDIWVREKTMSRAKAQRRQVRLEKKVYIACLRLGLNPFYFLALWERTEVRATEVDAPSPFPLPKGEGKEAHKVIEDGRCD